MRLRYLPAFALSVLLVSSGWAQTKATERSRNPDLRIPAAKRAGTTAKRTPGKPLAPDPDLLDGSIYEPEKRPLHGMLSEIEMGEQESEQKAEKISPDAGDPGGGGSEPPPPDQQGGSAEKPPEGPPAAPEGVQVADLKVPEGAEGQQGGGSQSKPRDLQIGDATLQIQPLKSTSPDIVGVQSTSTQQYEKKLPQGQQTDNRNRGVERGKEMPKGL